MKSRKKLRKAALKWRRLDARDYRRACRKRLEGDPAYQPTKISYSSVLNPAVPPGPNTPIRVISPDGHTRFIPRRQLDEPIKAGYRRPAWAAGFLP